jgi:hypothetical protein
MLDKKNNQFWGHFFTPLVPFNFCGAKCNQTGADMLQLIKRSEID